MNQVERGPSTFHAEVSQAEKAIILGWVAETQFRNIYWYHIVVVRWSWPFIRHVEAYVTDE